MFKVKLCKPKFKSSYDLSDILGMSTKSTIYFPTSVSVSSQ